MFRDLRFVVLDYPHPHLNNPDVRRSLADTVTAKQINFFRASPNYVSMNSLDMCSTHYLIYDVSNIYQPKLVVAMRSILETRAEYHELKLPVYDYINCAPAAYQKKFKDFKAKVGPLVDVSAWFVDPDYTFAKTGLPLSEILYYGMSIFVLRKGLHNWVGATNERFKASRWAMKTGRCEDGLIFTHPKVRDPHKLLLIEDFDYQWLNECNQKYGELMKSAQIVTPPSTPLPETLKSLDEVFQEIETKARRGLKVA